MEGGGYALSVRRSREFVTGVGKEAVMSFILRSRYGEAGLVGRRRVCYSLSLSIVGVCRGRVRF